jgi:hypothetical protein
MVVAIIGLERDVALVQFGLIDCRSRQPTSEELAFQDCIAIPPIISPGNGAVMQLGIADMWTVGDGTGIDSAIVKRVDVRYIP